jgi:hypothetical protein
VSDHDRGTSVALIYALVGERLTLFYEHGKWITDAQGATLAGEWLARSKRKMSLWERKQLSTSSDQIARTIAESVSREAGLHIAHEIQESLDPNYHSELGRTMMVECERVFDEVRAAVPPRTSLIMHNRIDE